MSATSLQSHADIIDALGAAVLATGLDLPDSHIRVMKTRNSIPAKYWPKVEKIAAAHKMRRVTVKLLERVAPIKKPRGGARRRAGS